MLILRTRPPRLCHAQVGRPEGGPGAPMCPWGVAWAGDPWVWGTTLFACMCVAASGLLAFALVEAAAYLGCSRLARDWLCHPGGEKW